MIPARARAPLMFLALALSFVSAAREPEPERAAVPASEVSRIAKAGSGASRRERIEAALLAATNRARREEGLRALANSTDLARAARAHAEDMLARGYFQHESPEGEGASDRLARKAPRAIVLSVKENIFMSEGDDGTGPEAAGAIAVEGWLNSKGHRANLLAKDVTDVGFGVAIDAQSEVEVVQMVQVLGSVMGRWEASPARTVRPPAEWRADLAKPLEFFMEDSDHPGRTYPDPRNPGRVWRGGVPLVLETESGVSRVKIPRLGPGTYTLMARRPGHKGFEALRRLEVGR